MKTIPFFRAAILLIGIVLSACAPSTVSTSPASAPVNVGAGKPVSDVVFTGVIESMSGEQWVVNGQTISVAPAALQGGPFLVGDFVKVQAAVAKDGSVVAQGVESPSAADLAEATATVEDASTQPPVFDDSGREAVGILEAISDSSVTMGGQTYSFAPGIDVGSGIVVGALVKVHFLTSADGTRSVTQIELADAIQSGGTGSDDNSNDTNLDNGNSNDNANDSNVNDDNDNDSNVNDDNGNDAGNVNDDNGNDDQGGDSNDEGGNDDNSNDSNG